MAEQGGVTDEVRAQRHESRANQTFARFIRDLSAVGPFSEETAVRAVAAVMCTLERRLTQEGAEHLEAQLPVRVKEIISECPRPPDVKLEKMNREEFLDRIASSMGVPQDEAELIARRVFTTVRAHITEGEADKVEAQLPSELKDLWAESQ